MLTDALLTHSDFLTERLVDFRLDTFLRVELLFVPDGNGGTACPLLCLRVSRSGGAYFSVFLPAEIDFTLLPLQVSLVPVGSLDTPWGDSEASGEGESDVEIADRCCPNNVVFCDGDPTCAPGIDADSPDEASSGFVTTFLAGCQVSRWEGVLLMSPVFSSLFFFFLFAFF